MTFLLAVACCLFANRMATIPETGKVWGLQECREETGLASSQYPTGLARNVPQKSPLLPPQSNCKHARVGNLGGLVFDKRWGRLPSGGS